MSETTIEDAKHDLILEILNAENHGKTYYANDVLLDQMLTQHPDLVANINAQEKSSMLGGAVSAAIYDDGKCMKIMLKHGVDFNKAEPDINGMKRGSTELHHAAEVGISSAIDILLEAGLSPNVRDEHDEFPLHHAMLEDKLYSDPEVIASLLNYGADPDALDNAGEKPDHYIDADPVYKTKKLPIQTVNSDGTYDREALEEATEQQTHIRNVKDMFTEARARKAENNGVPTAIQGIKTQINGKNESAKRQY